MTPTPPLDCLRSVEHRQPCLSHAASRLVGATARGIASTYAYDGGGNRVAQTTAAGTYAYVNDVATALPAALTALVPRLVARGFSYFG